MPLTATWLGRESLERIAAVRCRCYGDGPFADAAFLKKTERDRFADGDVLVLADDTGDVATATSLSLTMNVHGTPVACQGVAWVGTVRSHRRRRVGGRGLASRVMDLLYDKARERNQSVGLLAPFRVSFYEAFGYGVVERQHTWAVPLSLLPTDDTAGYGEYRDGDFDASLAGRQRQWRQTHGDIATDAPGLRSWIGNMADVGFRLVDRQGDRVVGQFTLGTEMENGRRIAVVHRPFYDSPGALRRMLSMLGTLRDQYSEARITLPTDVPINWWLKERQVPHRVVDHPAASCRAITRMQAAVFDVPTVVAALRPTPGVSGVVTIAVGETTWRIEVADGRASATATTADADVSTDPATSPAVLLGDLPPEAAIMLGRMTAHRPDAVRTLAAAVAGPTPYCHEYF